MSEITKAVGEWIVNNVGWSVLIFLFILSGLFKITKIELNPVGWIIGWIGKNFTKDVRKDVADMKKETENKIEALKTDLDSFEKKTDKSIAGMRKMTNGVSKSNDMQTVRQIRAHVLDFANSCMNKRRHTKNEFEVIINENTDYEKLVKKYKLENDVYKEDFEFIMKCYHKCQEEGSFLKESDFAG